MVKYFDFKRIWFGTSPLEAQKQDMLESWEGRPFCHPKAVCTRS